MAGAPSTFIPDTPSTFIPDEVAQPTPLPPPGQRPFPEDISLDADPSSFEPQMSGKEAFKSFLPLPEPIKGTTLAGKAAAAVANQGVQLAGGAASPGGLLSLPIGLLGRVGHIAGGLGFGVPAVTGGLKRVYQGAALGDLQEALEGAIQTGTGGLITMGGAKALLGKGKVPINEQDQIKGASGVPVEQQGFTPDRPPEVQAQEGTAQRPSESVNPLPQPAEVQEVATPPKISAKEYLRSIREQKIPIPERETITPSEDTPIGVNDAGDQLYQRKKDGTVYRMRNDRPTSKPNGYPDFGGDLSPVEPQEIAPPSAPTPGVRQQVPSDVAAKGEGVAAPSPAPANVESGTPEPVSQGPGAASPGDVPAAPPQAIASAAPIERGTQRPLGAVSSFSVGLNNAREALSNIGTTLKGFAGESLPKTTAANREVGEAGVRYASSRIAAKPLAETFTAKVLQGTDVDPVKFGAALTEDNLQSIRESLRQKATESLAEGRDDQAKYFTEQGNKVATIIGSKGSPFSTADEFHDYLQKPEVQRAIQQHIQMWQEVVDPQFREAQNIDPDTPLPTRGQQTGARVNLRAVFPEDEQANPVRGLVGSNLTGTFTKKSPFGIKARGTGETYDINYNNLIQNTFERQLEIANKNKFDDMLVASGNAVIDKPGKQVMIDGKPAVGFPLSRKVIIATKGKGTEPTVIPRAMNIYVKQGLANEYEGAAGVGTKFRSNVFSRVMNVINRAALSGLTDATVHVSNQLTALLDRPTSGKLLTDSLLSATGRADVPVTIVKAISKAFENNKEQMAELAEIGAMRPQDIHFGVFGRLLQKTDQLTRLMMDDTFKNLVDSGLVENTETARREYVNQIGQYNRRLQGKYTRFFRDTGLGPFVTAGKTFNALGVRMATMDPGAPGASPFASAALRANVISKWIGGAVLLGSLNYLLTHKLKNGGVLGRPGTPIGNMDFGTNDKNGKQQSFPLFSVLGLGRGLRVTGISGAVNAKRLGLTNADAAESASRDIINSWSAPFAGPPAKFGAIATTGYSPAVEVGRTSKIVPPGDNQRLENVKEAVRQASPLVQTYIKYREGKSIPEVLSSQIPRFTMTPGKTESMVDKYPHIVSLAQGNAFIDDMIHQARQLPKDQRHKFVNEQVQRLPKDQQSHGRSEAVRRKVYTN